MMSETNFENLRVEIYKFMATKFKQEIKRTID